MKKIWLGFVLVSGLSLPVAAAAADSTTVGVGTGAVAGALVGGPIGAVVGAVAGGVIGANSSGIRRAYRPRARTGYRRRAVVRSGPPRTRLAERASVSGPSAPPARPTASEIAPVRHTEPNGSTSSGWKDPR